MLIPGDGIGPAVMTATRAVIDAIGVAFDWDVREAGAAAVATTGDSLPATTVDAALTAGLVLKGPTATATSGDRSVSVRLRGALGTEFGVRPARSRVGVHHAAAGLDVVVLRMLAEDLYAGLELEPDDEAAVALRFALAARGRSVPADTAFSLKPMSAGGIERFARSALTYAAGLGRRRVTIVHKATVMRATDGRFRSIVEQVATEIGGFDIDDRLVDAACLELVRHPDRFDVLLAPVMYGDILSDVVAGLGGGLGLAPGANIGPSAAIFEPVHGTAPTLAGLDRANPLAAILTGAMLLRHIGEGRAAERIEAGVDRVLATAKVQTYDLGGWARDDGRAASTGAITDAVIAAIRVS